jgi:Flp pilus assembly pilin Flp
MASNPREGEGGESMLTLIQSFVPALVQRVRDREEGQTFVEYALVIGGISIVLLAAFAGLSGALGGVVDDITTALGG